MTDGIQNKPKVLHGAFVEYGLSLPPLMVVFQFNPLQLSRSRTLTYEDPIHPPRKFHNPFVDLRDLQEQQNVTVQEEQINLEIRLDATDGLNNGDAAAQQFGINPQLATLELMAYPKDEGLLSQAANAASQLLKLPQAFSFTRNPNPPLILFVFGRKRVLPVNINSLIITETEFSADLNPTRATVAVSMTVIEGKNIPYQYSKAMLESMSALNLAKAPDITSLNIPE